MRSFFKYIRQYKLPFIMLIIFTAVCAAVLTAYNADTEAALYIAALCFVISAAVAAVHFVIFRRKYTTLQRIAEGTLARDALEQLPKTETPIEEQYLSMLQRSCEERNDIQSRLRREQADSADFYTAWVHQIKTPITVMQMMLNEEDTQLNRALLSELFRIEQYTEMALCRSRLENDAGDLVIEQTNIDEVIRTSIRKYAPQFIGKRIRLVYGSTELFALTDKKWLGFIIDQLLSNAVKYTEDGCVSVTVENERILVEDTGIGIAQEDIPRIFEKGYTGYNGRNAAAQKRSTGLGLYLAKKAADKLSHRLYAQSRQGKGSTFVIDLHTEDIEFE